MATKEITDKQVVDAYLECSESGFSVWPYQLLSQRTGQPEKVCYRACERAERHGLIECGVSLRSGWLTEKGRELQATN